VISFADFAAEFPDGQVLARPAVSRSYGANPYTGYDSTQRPFLVPAAKSTTVCPLRSVWLASCCPGIVKAYPFTQVAAVGVINDEVGGLPLVILHKAGTASALDAGAISEGRDVGSVAVFDRRIDGDRTLNFIAGGDGVIH
jgi:hypothetical protein